MPVQRTGKEDKKMHRLFRSGRRTKGLIPILLIAAVFMVNCGGDPDSSGSADVCDCEGLECLAAVLIFPLWPFMCDSGSSGASATGADREAARSLLQVDSPSDFEDQFVAHDGDVFEIQGTVMDPDPGTIDEELYQGPSVIISNLTSGRSWLAEWNTSSVEADILTYHWRSPVSVESGRIVPGVNHLVVEADYGGGIYTAAETEIHVVLGSVM
jgi:hypothetical protein